MRNAQSSSLASFQRAGPAQNDDHAALVDRLGRRGDDHVTRCGVARAADIALVEVDLRRGPLGDIDRRRIESRGSRRNRHGNVQAVDRQLEGEIRVTGCRERVSRRTRGS